MVWRFECAGHSEKQINCDWLAGLSDSSQPLWGRGQKKWVPFVLWVLFGVVVWDLGVFETLHS